jgi:ribonucleoside-triphosphate reductase
MDTAARSLKTKRTIINRLLEEGLYPYTKRYLGSFDNHFSTIGLIGMNEACLNANWVKMDMTHKEAQGFTKDVLNHMRNRLADYQELYGDLYNLEATPAESTTYRLAKHDVELYPDIITASEKGNTPYYTNSSHLPVSYTEDVFEALDIQDELQSLYTSGTVFHAFLGEKLPTAEAASNLVRKIAENYKLPYYTMSPTYSICKKHGYISGEAYTCPDCGEDTEVYSRITGYYRPVKNWNEGKTQEYKERRLYEPDHSQLKRIKLSSEGNGDVKQQANELVGKQENLSMNDGIYFFTTKTCPNCKMARTFLEKSGLNFKTIDAEEDQLLAKELKVKQAPTVVVVNKEKIDRFVNASNIKLFAEAR